MTQSETFQATIDIDASSATEELNRAYAGIERLFRATSEAGEEIETPFLRGLDSINRMRGNIDDVTDQLKLFGEQGLQAANALEEIADPTRRLTEGQRLLATAIRQSRSDLAQLQDTAKVNIAENNLNDMTDTLNRLSPAGQRAAAHLSQVTDVQKRNAVAAQLMRAELAEKNGGGIVGAFRRLDDSMAISQAKFAALPTSMQALAKGTIPALATGLGGLASGGGVVSGVLGNMAGSMVNAAGAAGSMALGVAAAGLAVGAGLAAAVGAATVAVGKFALDGLAEWRKQSQAAQVANDNLERSTRGLKLAVGELVEDVLQTTLLEQGLAKITRDAAEEMDRLTSAQEANTNESKEMQRAREDSNRQLTGSIPFIGPLIQGYKDISAGLVEVGREEQARVRGLKDFSATTNIVTATITRLNDEIMRTADSSSDATKAMTTGMEGALDRGAELEALIRRIEEAWEDITALDRGVAVGSITEAGAEALTKKVADLDKIIKKNNKLQEDLDREREDSYKFYDFEQSHLLDKINKQLFFNKLKMEELAYNKTLREESGADGQIAGAQGGVEDFGQKLQSVQKGGVTPEEYKEVTSAFLLARANLEAALANPLITPEEAAYLEEKMNALNAKHKEFKEGVGVASSATTSIEGIGNAMNDAAKGAIMLGASMAAMGIEALVAGESLGSFGQQALAMFGSFASNAGQVILATGIGELALFSGNPGGAIAAGATLIGLGAVLSGLAKRNLKQGGGSGGGGAQAASQIIDTFASRNRREEDEPQPIIVYAQFGTERLEPAIAHAVGSAHRNGRLPRRR